MNEQEAKTLLEMYGVPVTKGLSSFPFPLGSFTQNFLVSVNSDSEPLTEEEAKLVKQFIRYQGLHIWGDPNSISQEGANTNILKKSNGKWSYHCGTWQQGPTWVPVEGGTLVDVCGRIASHDAKPSKDWLEFLARHEGEYVPHAHLEEYEVRPNGYLLGDLYDLRTPAPEFERAAIVTGKVRAERFAAIMNTMAGATKEEIENGTFRIARRYKPMAKSTQADINWLTEALQVLLLGRKLVFTSVFEYKGYVPEISLNENITDISASEDSDSIYINTTHYLRTLTGSLEIDVSKYSIVHRGLTPAGKEYITVITLNESAAGQHDLWFHAEDQRRRKDRKPLRWFQTPAQEKRLAVLLEKSAARNQLRSSGDLISKSCELELPPKFK